MNQKWAKVYLGASIHPIERVNGKVNRVNHHSKGIWLFQDTLKPIFDSLGVRLNLVFWYPKGARLPPCRSLICSVLNRLNFQLYWENRLYSRIDSQNRFSSTFKDNRFGQGIFDFYRIQSIRWNSMFISSISKNTKIIFKNI